MTTPTKIESLDQRRTQEAGDRLHHLKLDAQASLQAVFESSDSLDLLRRSLGDIPSREVLSGITVAQVMRTPGLASHWVASMLALGARVSFVEEAQEIALANYLRCVEPDHGPIAAVYVPLDTPGSVTGEAYLSCSKVESPVVAIAEVILTEGFVREARLALTRVWDEPTRLADSSDLLIGGPLTMRRIRQVAEAVDREVNPPGKGLSAAQQPQIVAGLLAYCALEQCRQAAMKAHLN